MARTASPAAISVTHGARALAVNRVDQRFLKYESTLRFVNGQVKTMLDAIKGTNS